MIRRLSIATVFATALALSATAQDTKTVPAPITAAPSLPTSIMITLTEQQAKDWIDKPVYSSDGKKIGEVVLFQRDADNHVIGMHADNGGFLGLGQTRVNVTPLQLTLKGDRVLLDLTAAQAKELPKVQS